MYVVECTDADTLVSVIHDVLQRLNLTVSKVRGSVMMVWQQHVAESLEWQVNC